MLSVQYESATALAYLTQLKQIAEFCNYGDSLNEVLRDRLVCGIAHSQWQKCLLSKDDLTNSKAVKLLLSMESADKEVKGLGSQSAKKQQLVNHVTIPRTGHTRSPQSDSLAGKACYRCGKDNHKPAKCRFKELTCHYCNKRGHLASVCKTKLKQISKKNSGTHQVTEEVETLQEDATAASQEYQLYYVHPEGTSSFTVNINVNDKPLCLEVDTGAALSIISESTCHTLWPEGTAPALRNTNARLKSYTGDVINIKGTMNVDATYKEEKAKNLPLIIVESRGSSLLGRNWLKHFHLDWSQLNNVQEDKEMKIQELMDPDLFKEGLGKVTVAMAKIYLEENAQFQFQNFRQVPYAKQEKVEAEIKRLFN